MMQSAFSWLDERYDKLVVEEAIMGDDQITDSRRRPYKDNFYAIERWLGRPPSRGA
jgi:hypothetical protein